MHIERNGTERNQREQQQKRQIILKFQDKIHILVLFQMPPWKGIGKTPSLTWVVTDRLHHIPGLKNPS